jgi:uncharacterized membrane protein YedE/YeeE
MHALFQPWPWYVVGPLIAVVLITLLYWGKRFGLSRNFQLLCSVAGLSSISDYFNIDWATQRWNLVFLAGTMLGAFVGHHYLSDDPFVMVAESTETYLNELGIASAGTAFQPDELFAWHSFSSQGWLLLVVGGFLVGFGTRYANGCTSGHAISGLSNLQLPSLIAVIGFFAGGLLMTWFILPHLIF